MMKNLIRSLAALGALLLVIVSSTAAGQTPPWSALPDGSPDPRFGDGGIVTSTNFASGGSGAIQSEGKILVARLVGQFGDVPQLSRYNVDGSLDQTFGTGGIVTGTCGGSALTVQPDGKLLAFTNNNKLARCHADGSLDAGFGSAGVVTTPWPASSFAVGADGRIVVAGTAFSLARYLANGQPDSTFGSGGVVALNFTYRGAEAAAVTIQFDDKVVVVGRGASPGNLDSDFLLARVNQDGTADLAFGNSGVVFTDFGRRVDYGKSVLQLPDGQLVVGGEIGSNGTGNVDMGAASYFENGTLNHVVKTLTFSTSRLIRIVRQLDGKLVAIGNAQSLSPPFNTDIVVAQYNSDLTVDTTFGVGGKVVIDNGRRSDLASSLFVQPDGQIVVLGTAGSSFVCEDCSRFSFLARYRYDSGRGVFRGPTRPVPAHIEAEDYDLGGQGTGYYDTTAGNESGTFVYRTDDVDLKLSSEGGHAVGWFTAGEWLAYTIDVPRDGAYTVAARVGSALPGRTFHLAVDGTDVTGPIPVPNVGAWDTYGTAARRISLSAGRHVLRVVMGTADFMEIQSLDITEAGPGEIRGGDDFDGDGRADLMVFRPASGGWYINNGTSSLGSFGWGLPGDVPLAGDVDGDGRTDLTVWRPSTGTWYIRESSSGYSEAAARVIQWGLPGDVPITGDFDGDGRSELTVFRPATGMWYMRLSSRAYAVAEAVSYQWGLPGDLPLVADFDADGQSELTVFRPSTGTWHLRYSSQAYAVAEAAAVPWGLPGDVPIAADFDGDGQSELTVFRPSTGTWYLRYSSRAYAIGEAASVQWGLPGDVPISSDFDGDGRTDLTVYRPATGYWFVRYSMLEYDPARAAVYQWGLRGDIPVQ